MATHDYVLANASGAAFRADLNNALAAIVSNNSNSTEPATTYAYMWWADTTNGQLKLRNAANDDWVVIQELDGTLLMEDGTVGAPGLAFASDLDTGFFRPNANQLAIATNGAERVEFGASEVVFNDGGADYDFRIEGDTNANLLFVNASTDRVGIGTSTATANGGVLELSGGITFPATAVAASNANTLDDYEEGTFTPVVYGATTAGTGTYTTQVGAYTKIGNVVHITISLSWTAHTGTGSVRISGLPFANGTVSSAGSTLAIRASGLSLSANNTLVGAQVPDGDTYIIIHEYPVGGGAISGVDMDTNASIWLSGHYFL